MERRPLGATGARVAAIGQGTWDLERDDRASAIAALRRGIDLGMTHIDTAEMYGHGAVEELVGEAIAGRRDEVFLASKVLPDNASRAGTVRACERSLRRLGTDRIDLYLLHWPGRHPLEETLAAFEQLRSDGKIQYFGVSNFDVEEMEHARRIAGDGQLACNQVLYHLGERAVEHAVEPWCANHGVALVAYSPFGSGRFPSLRGAGGKVLDEIARAHGVTAHQVALRFLLRRPSVLVIPKAGRVGHAEDNAAAAALRLEEGELERIGRAFPLGRERDGVPTL
jgi:diketogulonate reductase-like aldo/keto reductase